MYTIFVLLSAFCISSWRTISDFMSCLALKPADDSYFSMFNKWLSREQVKHPLTARVVRPEQDQRPLIQLFRLPRNDFAY